MRAYSRRHRAWRRRGGQPVLLIADESRLVDTIAALARLLFRYRSELAPFTTALTLAIAAVALHATHRDWWPWALATTVLVSVLSLTRGVPWGVSRTGERVYAAAATATAGGWLTVATALGRHGPLCPPFSLSARWRTACRGGHTGAGVPAFEWTGLSKPGPTSPKPSALPAHGCCPPSWTSGDGAPGWRYGRDRPSAMSLPRCPRSSPGSVRGRARCAWNPIRRTQADSRCESSPTTRTPERSLGAAQPLNPWPTPSTSACSKTRSASG